MRILMVVPDALQAMVAEALHLVDQSPQHHLDWRFRQTMYPAFGPPSDPTVSHARGWLAVMAAEYVLPIFLDAGETYLEYLPRDILRATKALLGGTGDLKTAAALEDQGYHGTGHWCLSDDPNYSWRADIAAFAAYKAAVEARGGLVEPFKSAEFFSKRTADGDLIYGSDYTDIDWAGLAACGDTAGCAAVAYACDLPSRAGGGVGFFNAGGVTVARPRRQAPLPGDSEKLRAFWQWWLRKAIPTAWMLAVYSSASGR